MGFAIGSTNLSVSLVVPTRNEARNIEWVLERVPDCVDEIILVDSSSDETVDVARRARADVRVLAQPPSGKGDALRRGFDAAVGDVIVMIDADGSMNPREIPMFLGAIYSGFDLVKGSRYMGGGGSVDFTRVRRIGNRALVKVVNVLYRAALSDLCYGYIAFRRECAAQLVLEGSGFEIETEIVTAALRTGLLIGEVPSSELERRFGESNLRPIRDGFRILHMLMRRRRARYSQPSDVRALHITPLRSIDLTAMSDAVLPPVAVVNGHIDEEAGPQAHGFGADPNGIHAGGMLTKGIARAPVSPNGDGPRPQTQTSPSVQSTEPMP